MAGSSKEEGFDHKYPTWNGEWGLWNDYVLRCELKADGMREEDRELLGPRLASNLTAKAFDLIIDIDREKLRQKDGYQYFLKYLEGTRGKEKIDLLGDAFTDFFLKKDTYRKDGEELADYEPRFRALVRRLEKALKESGATGTLHSEVLGWYLLNCYMKKDPSDIANVRGRSESYKLKDVLASLQKMWSGGGLAAKDQERKKRKETSGQTMLADVNETEEIYFENQEMEEDKTDESAELEDVKTWYQESLAALVEEPDDMEVYVNFKDARKALDAARTSRGFYPVTGPGQRGKGFVGKGKGHGKGKTDFAEKTCVRCGKRGHIAGVCPQKPGNRGSGDGGRINYVKGATGDDDERVCVISSQTTYRDEVQVNDDEKIWNSHEKASQTLDGFAIVDSGASDNVIDVNTLQELMAIYDDYGFDSAEEFDVDRSLHKQFVYGSDHTSAALGVVHFSAGLLGKFVDITAHVVEGNTPLLLSARFLAEQKCRVDFRTGETVFGKISDDTTQGGDLPE